MNVHFFILQKMVSIFFWSIYYIIIIHIVLRLWDKMFYFNPNLFLLGCFLSNCMFVWITLSLSLSVSLPLSLFQFIPWSGPPWPSCFSLSSALQWLVCSSRRRQSGTRSIIVLTQNHFSSAGAGGGTVEHWSHLHLFTGPFSLEPLHWMQNPPPTHTHTPTHRWTVAAPLVSGCLYPLLCDGWQLESTPQPHDLHQHIKAQWNKLAFTPQMVEVMSR